MPPPAATGIADLGDGDGDDDDGDGDDDDGDEADDDGAAARPRKNPATMPAGLVRLPAVVVATADGTATPSATGVWPRIRLHTLAVTDFSRELTLNTYDPAVIRRSQSAEPHDTVRLVSRQVSHRGAGSR